MKDWLSIRAAGPSDAEGIASVHIRSSADAYAPLARDWPAQDLDDRAARWRESLDPGNRDRQQIDLVATTHLGVVAFLGAGAARRTDIEAEVEVYVIHVLPEHRGRGIGSRLWREACVQLRGPELAAMYVETIAELRCCSFYRAHGGSVICSAPGELHGGQVTEVVFVWPKGTPSERLVPP
jgi:ribosomal protein S18 acetylase RimI-like enzyme